MTAHEKQQCIRTLIEKYPQAAKDFPHVRMDSAEGRLDPAIGKAFHLRHERSDDAEQARLDYEAGRASATSPSSWEAAQERRDSHERIATGPLSELSAWEKMCARNRGRADALKARSDDIDQSFANNAEIELRKIELRKVSLRQEIEQARRIKRGTGLRGFELMVARNRNLVKETP